MNVTDAETCGCTEAGTIKRCCNLDGCLLDELEPVSAFASFWCSLVEPHPLNVCLFLFAWKESLIKCGKWGKVGYSHMHPTKRASNADGTKFGCSLVPGPRLNTLMSKGSSLPACLARSSRFSIPVAWSKGSLITEIREIKENQ